MHQSGITADEIDAHIPRSPIHGAGDGGDILGGEGVADHGNGGDGNALVDDGNAEFRLNALTDGDEILGAAGDLVINLLAEGIDIRIHAVPQADAHGDGADIQMLLGDHMDGLEYIPSIDHKPCTSDLVHGVKDGGMHAVDLKAHAFAHVLKLVLQHGVVHVKPGDIHQHDHGKEIG